MLLITLWLTRAQNNFTFLLRKPMSTNFWDPRVIERLTFLLRIWTFWILQDPFSCKFVLFREYNRKLFFFAFEFRTIELWYIIFVLYAKKNQGEIFRSYWYFSVRKRRIYYLFSNVILWIDIFWVMLCHEQSLKVNSKKIDANDW